MLITSLENKKVKLINSLKQSKTRKELGLFVVEGMHLVKEAYANNCLEDILLLEENNLEFDCSLEPTIVTYDVMKKITNLSNPANVIGICRIKNNHEIKGKRILILDDIQDPGNLGTIIRSCVAFSVDTVILSENCVDLYNEKVIRSTQGMIFNTNYVIGDLELIIKELKEDGYLILGTDVSCGTDVRTVNALKFALIMGNEGRGVREEIKRLCDKNLYIKMNDACESLNVGVATSILLYELGDNHE